VHKAELSQPLCTALQVALFNKYAALGVIPDTVVGHSSGEIAAAYAAGYISMEEAIVAAYYRGFVTKNATLKGAMAAVGMGASELDKYMIKGVVLACENSPSSSTISGDREKVLEVVEAIKRDSPETFVRPLKVDMAYHSRELTRSLSHFCRTALMMTLFRPHGGPQQGI
jgi:acyl transferase domain-containing protein